MQGLLPLDFPSGNRPLSWLFLVIFGPLMLASLHFCGTDSSLRRWKPNLGGDLDSDGQRGSAGSFAPTKRCPAPESHRLRSSGRSTS